MRKKIILNNLTLFNKKFWKKKGKEMKTKYWQEWINSMYK